MTTLQELLAQRAELEKLIDTTQKSERSEVLAKVKSLMAEYNLTVDDLAAKAGRGKPNGVVGAVKEGGRKGSTVAAKYRDPTSGNTWSGRGLQPKWLKAAIADGKSIGEFAI